MSWFDYKHPEYEIEEEKWIYARDHYEARVLDKDYIGTYLVKRKQAETDDGYQERKDIADYTPFFAYVVESMSAQLFAVDDKTQRVWQDEESQNGMGDPEEQGTPAFTLTNNADGEGTNWTTLWKRSSMDASVYRRLWFLVDPKTEARNQPVVKIINPLDVTDWHEESGKLVQVKVRDTEFLRSGIFELNEDEDQCLVFTLDGWARYVHRSRETINEQGYKETEFYEEKIDQNAYYFEDRDGTQRLPIYYVDLPLRRNSGYILSKKNNAIFNKESAKDWLEWAANFPKLVHYASDELFKQTATNISEGSNFIQGDENARHATEYIAPSIDPATVNKESLQQKIEHFLYVAFKEYSDSGRQKTATEVRQDLASGVGAYLELLKSFVDEAENTALWLIEQCYFPAKTVTLDPEGNVKTDTEIPANKELWGQARVERSSDFIPIDKGEMIKQLKEDVFGFETVPTDTESKLNAASQVLDFHNIPYNEEALKEAVESRQATASQGRDIDREIDSVLNA